jgi:NAD(P)-dependent dehydrogenase (short-subunit alcohol dehydrogenase family)
MDTRANLAGKTAVVMGGAGGLGRYVVDDLLEAGLRLAVCDRDAGALARLRDDTRSVHPPLLQREMDVRDDDGVTSFVQEVDAAFERIDVLVNVVGGTFQSPFMETYPKAWDALIRTNFRWVLTSTQRVAEVMRRRGSGGSIVNLSSVSASQPTPGAAVHGAMKLALEHFARALALELGKDGIRINNIQLFTVPTPERLARTGEEQRRRDARRDALLIPLKRSGRPEDLTNSVLFLASDLSSYMTGATLFPDGGRVVSSAWFDWPDSGYSLPMSPAVLDFFAPE